MPYKYLKNMRAALAANLLNRIFGFFYIFLGSSDQKLLKLEESVNNR